MPADLFMSFDGNVLETRLKDAGIDLVIASSKQNVQYFLNGYRFFFFAAGDDAIGRTSYVPALGYPVGRRSEAFYVGNPIESDQQHFEPIWISHVHNDVWNGTDVADRCAQRIVELGLAGGTIGLEMPFISAEAFVRLRELLPDARFVDAVEALESVRAVKRADEILILRDAADLIIESMLATFARSYEGITTAEISQILREEETQRGLHFVYSLVSTGGDCRRAPSTRTWDRGKSLSLDSGGSLRGYAGDLARMAIIGPPNAEQRALLEAIERVQSAARKHTRAGVLGEKINAAAAAALTSSSYREVMHFEAHGMGLVHHEQPQLFDDDRLRCKATHVEKPLEEGMVLSVETRLRHPEVGFLKLEDAIVVTADGYEALGDRARGWTVVD
jgi:Xaa-Pro dipeptidase